MAGWIVLDNRIQRLEREQRRRAGAVSVGDWYEFKVSATCPPTTAVHVRGGILYESPDGPGAGRALEIPTADAELGPSGIDGGAPAFATANYYRGIVLLQSGEPWAGDPVGFMYQYDTGEYVTATEAEDGVWTNVIEFLGPYLSELPLVILIVRNDGTTGTDGAILPIDAVNRGRSYLWRDIRPRYMVSRNII